MSREMKFRAWDRLRKQMCNVICLNCHRNDDHILQRAKPIPCVENPCYNIDADSIDLMQYTGLKDRNGEEIYDGDIVKLRYGIPPTFDTLLIEYAEDETVGDISVSGWWMRNIRPNGVSGSLCKTYENDLEIIGNVHENPELLENKQ